MPKKMTFDIARDKIRKKNNYLDLIAFSSLKENAIFFDKEYGEFTAKYNSILYGWSNHPERSKFNKIKGSSSKSSVNKRKQTNLKKYGVENVLQSKEIQFKIKQTNLEKYGCENPFQNNIIKNKIKKTNILKYGTEYPQKNKEIKDKIKQTNLKKYGVEYVLQLQEIKDKIKQTNLKKYGCECFQQNKIIQQKQILTKIKNNYVYNINGSSLAEYYKKSDIKKYIAYVTLQQNYKKYGYSALNKNHYNKLSGRSKMANLWLSNIEKELGYSIIKEYHIPNTKYHADGYDLHTNTIYEFYGDYWHGNLKKFAAYDIHPVIKLSYKELYDNTTIRQNEILKLNYNVVYIWETDFIDSIKSHN